MYAGAVWCATEPGMERDSEVVRIFASRRFDSPSDVITLHDQFDVPETRRGIEERIFTLSTEFGVSSKNKNYQRYQRDYKRRERKASVMPAKRPMAVEQPAKKAVLKKTVNATPKEPKELKKKPTTEKPQPKRTVPARPTRTK